MIKGSGIVCNQRSRNDCDGSKAFSYVVFFNNFFYLYIFKSNDFLVKMGGTSRTS